MDKLRPDKLELEVSDPEAGKKLTHWLRCVGYYIESIDNPQKPVNKLQVLIQLVSHTIFELIEDATNYEGAVKILKGYFIKEANVLYARHALITCKQKEGQSIKEFVSILNSLSKQCEFTDVNASQNKNQYVREALVQGLRNPNTRRKVLESSEKELEKIINLATVYEEAQENAAGFNSFRDIACPIVENESSKEVEDPVQSASAAIKRGGKSPSRTKQGSGCSWCGYHRRHSKDYCPARESKCHNCGLYGHYSKVCNRPSRNSKGAASVFPTLASITNQDSLQSSPQCLKSAVFELQVGVGNKTCEALFDTGAAGEFISPQAVQKMGLKIHPEEGQVYLANSQISPTRGYVMENLTVHGKKIQNVKLTLLPDAVAPIILGQDFLLKNKFVKFNVSGTGESSFISTLGTLKVEPPKLFQNLSPDCHPIAAKSRRYTFEDKLFIKNEVSRLLNEGIIEKSTSPWRAQPFVTGGGNQKKRMVVDYSETINLYTLLDAYPLPLIEDVVNECAQYKIFTPMDLKSAYHQMEIPIEDRPYTAFAACGGLYQFCRVPFGVTNGVPCFQRAMDSLVADNSLKGVIPYMDNITICGRTQVEHDENLKNFLNAAKKINLTFNMDKCEFSTTKLFILGSVVENGEIRPDPERLKPLQDLSPPTDPKSLKRILGLFSYYSPWIRDFSDKIKLLVKADTFPLSAEVCASFESLKKDIAESVKGAINSRDPFTVETDASNFAIAATLNQGGRPVAFFSRTLRGAELKHASVEKEAQAIIEAIRHWRHFLTGRHFTLVTDQQSVKFMFDTKRKGKIKNEKIMRWRMELLCYNFDIIYKPGIDNIPPDVFSRNCSSVCAVTHSASELKELHESLCHPGVTRMAHFVKVRNLPFTLDEIRKINNSCKQCSEVKPRFYKPPTSQLIKATQPFERLNVDFKGPLPSTNQNRYFLNIVDEYSRFPFVIPVPDMSSSTIINSFCSLFSMFGMPSMIHSDRGASFLSNELKKFLSSKGINTSRTTPYHPQGNGQVEKMNGTIWRAITLSLRSKNLPQSHWQEVLPDVLHSVRTLLCTSTNATPHERLFNFNRRSGTGTSLPSWLSEPGKVLLRRFVRQSKQEPLVDEVDLLEANPQYAHIKFPNGRETTVSVRDLAPVGEVRDLPGDSGLPGDLNLPGNLEVPKRSGSLEKLDPVVVESSHVLQRGLEHQTASPVDGSNESNTQNNKLNGVTGEQINPGISPKENTDSTCLRRSQRAVKAPDRLIMEM